ncbi:uncharacterized protein LOC127835330 [Dreissena polymorpha]|uniref:Uncharacterized protein n=1 Tax=Dreissena polymorpha TaxID=45954 RepID=A0A9D4JKF0_DREPO|nr:uncharacterized protein LOC127835330 [Dreissena polymorpha]KAH3812058.1 hypothetical protein DPMN_140480 [Dreissena polymorpha]
MVLEDIGSNVGIPVPSTLTPAANVTNSGQDNNYNPHDEDFKSYPSDTVAAVTIAVLAVVIIITMIIVFRALRKRQRARRGEQFGESIIPTVTTGVMGTGGAAYANALNNRVPVESPVRWESVNPSTQSSTQSEHTDTSYMERTR